MFQNHPFTKAKINVSYFANYENLHQKIIDNHHKQFLNNCDIFIYQPTNKNYDYSEYNIDNIRKYLKNECKIIRVNYYRTRAFWYGCDYIPYTNYKGYIFHTITGIYKDMRNISNKLNKEKVVDFINNIQIDNETIINFFKSEVEKINILDEKSDVKMYNFFKLNYNDNLLFFDPFHPSNIFIYEIFRQLVKQIFNHELPEKDLDFLNEPNVKYIELDNLSVPILP